MCHAARQEVFGSHPAAGDADLLSGRGATHITQTFVDVSCAYNAPPHLLGLGAHVKKSAVKALPAPRADVFVCAALHFAFACVGPGAYGTPACCYYGLFRQPQHLSAGQY